MTERYPDDATLLALEEDPTTGVEYIPTGRSPYYLEFRKLVQRTLLAAERANDLRVYVDGDLTVGVRPGRCVIHSTPITFAGATAHAVANNATTQLWLDAAGTLQSGPTLPTDRTDFLPLAEVVTAAGSIEQIIDRRAEAFLAVPDLAQLGVTATGDELNQALDGIGINVTAAALNRLTAGAESVADLDHQHTQVVADYAGEGELRLRNDSGDASSTMALRFDLPNRLPHVISLLLDPDTGYLVQRYGGNTMAVVGSVHVQHLHVGPLNASLSHLPVGVAPISGRVVAVGLSVGSNIISTDTLDGLALEVAVNGNTVTDTPASITAAAGSGFRSTDRGDGTTAVVTTGGNEQVTRGDLFHIDLTRTANGSVSQEATDVAVLIVIQADTAL